MIDEFVSNIVNTSIANFSFPFCITTNIATYLIIKCYSDWKKVKLGTWSKRFIFFVCAIIVAIVYTIEGTTPSIILNSFILAPVSWSWIFKPICDKLNIGYNKKKS